MGERGEWREGREGREGGGRGGVGVFCCIHIFDTGEHPAADGLSEALGVALHEGGGVAGDDARVGQFDLKNESGTVRGSGVHGADAEGVDEYVEAVVAFTQEVGGREVVGVHEAFAFG